MPLYPIDPLEQDVRDATAAEARIAVTRGEAYVQGLRDLADFLDSRPDLLAPTTSGVTVYFWAHLDADGTSNSDVEDVFVEKALSLGDDREDKVAGNYFNSELRFGPHKFQVTRPINLDAPAPSAPPHPLA